MELFLVQFQGRELNFIFVGTVACHTHAVLKNIILVNLQSPPILVLEDRSDGLNSLIKW